MSIIVTLTLLMFPFLSQPSDYLLDVTTIYERRSVPYQLYFRKVLWFAPVRDRDNVAYITMMFDQVRVRRVGLATRRFN